MWRQPMVIGVLLVLLLAPVVGAQEAPSMLEISAEDPRGDVEIVSSTGESPPPGSMDWVESWVRFNSDTGVLEGFVRLVDSFYQGIWYMVLVDSKYFTQAGQYRYLAEIMFVIDDEGVRPSRLMMVLETPSGTMAVPGFEEFRIEGDSLYFKANIAEGLRVKFDKPLSWELYVTLTSSDGPDPSSMGTYLAVDEGSRNDHYNPYTTTTSDIPAPGGTGETNTTSVIGSTNGYPTGTNETETNGEDGTPPLTIVAVLAVVGIIAGVLLKALGRGLV